MKMTADLYDEHGEDLSVLAPVFRDFGGLTNFSGFVTTLKVYEDNSLVRDMLETSGSGRVLVVDGGGSLRCALVGDNLALLAQKNDWAGIVVFGCIRDSEQISRIEIGLKALATNPRKSVKKGEGISGAVLRFADAIIEPDCWLSADADGIVLSKIEL
jgi:regulator of ribonuclease activity A